MLQKFRIRKTQFKYTCAQTGEDTERATGRMWQTDETGTTRAISGDGMEEERRDGLKEKICALGMEDTGLIHRLTLRQPPVLSLPLPASPPSLFPPTTTSSSVLFP